MSLYNKVKFLINYPKSPFQYLLLRRELYRHKTNNKQTWVFQCDFRGHFPYLKPYYEQAKHYDDIEIYFTFGYSNDTELEDFLVSQGISRERILCPLDLIAFTDWDVYVSPTEWGNLFPSNPDCLRVQIFHTLGDKGMEYGEELLKFNVIFVNGPIHHSFLEKYVFLHNPRGRDKCKILNIGFAKLDELFNGSSSNNTIRETLGIEPSDNRRIILYAPNWETSSALEKYGEKVFDIIAETNYIVLIKLHYMSLISKDDHKKIREVDPSRKDVAPWKDWKAVLDKYRTFENVRIIEDQNINPYLLVSDLMITDYGGASLEFMCLDKPIIYLDCPEFFEIRGQHIFEKEARNTGHLLRDPLKIPEIIASALEDPEPYATNRKKLIRKLLYNPGKAAEYGVNSLYNLIRNKKSSLVKNPAPQANA